MPLLVDPRPVRPPERLGAPDDAQEASYFAASARMLSLPESFSSIRSSGKCGRVPNMFPLTCTSKITRVAIAGDDDGSAVSRAERIPAQAVPFAIIVAGPTASGKSALALTVAERLNGVTGLDPVIINADAMQCYRDLRILTARPTPDEEARVSHALYGVRAADEPGSVAWWRDAALGVMAEAHRSGRLPILTGGTGLYFS